MEDSGWKSHAQISQLLLGTQISQGHSAPHTQPCPHCYLLTNSTSHCSLSAIELNPPLLYFFHSLFSHSFLLSRRPLTRRFIIVEGIYANYGDMAPLDRIHVIKEKYKYRLLVEESFSFGVVGRTGRGACEHFGLQPNQVRGASDNDHGVAICLARTVHESRLGRTAG